MQRFDARSRRWVVLVTLLAGLYCTGTIFAPLLEHLEMKAGSWLRLGYAPACHQLRDRCLDLGFGPLAVCARCFGLYAGGFLGLLAGASLGIRVRPSFRWLLAACAPTLLDFVAAQLGLPSLSNWPRFLLALPPGILMGLLLADAIAGISASMWPPAGDRRCDPLQ